MPADSGRLLTTPRGESFRFDAGAVCLDFAHTGGSGRWGVYETLHAPADLADWLWSPPLSARPERVSVEDLEQAKRLRGAIHRSAWALTQRRRPSRGDLDAINEAARAAPLAPQLDRSGARSRWATPIDASQALSVIAREAIELLSSPLADRIRQCGAEDCTLVFVDTSRPGRRRWCSMRRCGNRHKLRAFRARQQ